MKQGPVFKCILNRRGQAAVEYVLLMIVIVTLLFSFKGVFSSLNAFMSDFMGKYVVCLMEHGELPALGVQEADLKKHITTSGKKCEFSKFAANVGIGGGGGSGGSGGGSGSGGSGSGGSSSSSNNSSRSANGDSSRGGGGSGGGDSSDGSSVAGNSGRSSSSGSSRGRGRRGQGSSPYTNGTVARQDGFRTADSGESVDESKTKVIENVTSNRGGDDYDRENSRTRRFRGSRDGNGRYVAITGSGMDEDKKETKRPRTPSSSVSAIEGGYALKPYRKTFSPPEIKSDVALEEKEEEFAFGNIFKWLVIAGIVIACIVLFGGQVMSYSNSSD